MLLMVKWFCIAVLWLSWALGMAALMILGAPFVVPALIMRAIRGKPAARQSAHVVSLREFRRRPR